MIMITKKQAQQFILIKQGLYGPYKFSGKNGVLNYIKQAGCIQYDPIDICGKNHELVLQARVEGFKKTQLNDLLYGERKLVDLYDKNMSITSMEDWPYLDSFRNHYRNGGRFKTEIDKVSDEILEYIKNRGPVCSADIEYSKKVDWYWAPTSLAKAALDTLYFRGDLVVHHKKNTRKYYDLAANCIPLKILSAKNPNTTDEEKADWHLLRRIKSLGMLWNRTSDALLGIENLKTPQRNSSFQRLITNGKIEELVVEDVKYPLYIASEDIELLNYIIEKELKSERTEFIAPLDNVMWDRRLIEELFGFYYKWEIYTPAVDRKFGYYILPLLYKDSFIGRIEIKKNRKTDIQEISNLWFEDEIRETKKIHESINKRLEKFNIFYKS